MFFLATHLGILLITLFFAVLGTPLAEMVPWKLRPAARAYLTPALGLAAVTLLVSPWGWLGSGFAQAGVRVAALSVFGLTLLWMILCRPESLKPLPRLLALASLCALPFTLQLLFCEAYDPFNDAFTYIVQSQWLQHHNMAGVLNLHVDEPALSQIRFTQVTGTRASAQFVFGFEQAILGIKWAHEAYPIAICAAAAAGCLTVAFASQAALRRPARWFPPLAACFCGLSMNGYAFGELNGFYPQTVGLACGFAALWMFGLTLSQNNSRRKLLSCLPVAVAAGGSLYAYSEFFPLLLLSMGGASVFALILAGKKQRPLLAGHILLFGGLLLLLICPEIPRAARAIVSQSHAIVGGAVLWGPLDFLMHAAGFRSDVSFEAVLSHAVKEQDDWLGASEAAAITLSLLMLAGAIIQASRLGFNRSRMIALCPVLTLLALAIVLFVKFRYDTLSPFPVGMGQSWNQFKLAGWSALGVIGLLGSLSNGGANSKGALQICVGAVWCLAILLSVWAALAMARPRAALFAQAVGNKQSPMEGVFQFRAEVNRIAPAGAALHLDLSPDLYKLREFLAYVWMDRGVLADWTGDGYIADKITLPSNAEIWAPDWIVTNDAGRSSEDVASLGALKLRRARNLTVNIAAVDGAFDQEQSGPDWWRWVERTAVFHVHSQWRASPGQPIPIHVRFSVMAIDNEPAEIEVTAQNGQVLESRSVNPGAGMIAYDISEPDAAKLGNDWTIRFSSRGEAIALGPNDPRKAAFMIRDLTVNAGP